MFSDICATRGPACECWRHAKEKKKSLHYRLGV